MLSKLRKQHEIQFSNLQFVICLCEGIIPQLHHRYEMGVSGTKAAWLAIDTDHYASTVGDAGWGCGYRNLQMLISALLRMDIYRPVMFSGEYVFLYTQSNFP